MLASAFCRFIHLSKKTDRHARWRQRTRRTRKFFSGERTNENYIFGERGKLQILINYSQASDGKIKSDWDGKTYNNCAWENRKSHSCSRKDCVLYARITVELLCQDREHNSEDDDERVPGVVVARKSFLPFFPCLYFIQLYAESFLYVIPRFFFRFALFSCVLCVFSSSRSRWRLSRKCLMSRLVLY